MKQNKLVTIDIKGQTKIGVIPLGDLSDLHKDDFRSFFTKKVEPQLVELLQGHYVCPIKIRVPATVQSFHPLTVNYVVLIESDGEDFEETVTLNETWM